jgi:hypothetical protein
MDFSKYNYKDSQMFNNTVKLDRYSMNIDESIEYFKNMLCKQSLDSIQNIYGIYNDDDFSNENIRNNENLINLSSIFFLIKLCIQL